MVFFSNKNSTPLRVLQIGAVGELTICGKKSEGVNGANVLKCDFFDANHVCMI
jgi:hypothetical protein